jgi:hypothetical protein
MKALIALAALLLIGIGLGIVHIQRSNSELEITIDKNRLRETTSKAVNAGRKLLEEVDDAPEEMEDAPIRSQFDEARVRYDEPRTQIPFNFNVEETAARPDDTTIR